MAKVRLYTMGDGIVITDCKNRILFGEDLSLDRYLIGKKLEPQFIVGLGARSKSVYSPRELQEKTFVAFRGVSDLSPSFRPKGIDRTTRIESCEIFDQDVFQEAYEMYLDRKTKDIVEAMAEIDADGIRLQNKRKSKRDSYSGGLWSIFSNEPSMFD